MNCIKLKRTITMVACIISLLTLSSESIALPITAFKPFTPIDMKAAPNRYGGIDYMFSDFPESITDYQFDNGVMARHTISRQVPGARDYAVEFYHMNKTKLPLRVGVALINKSSEASTATINNIAKGDCLRGSGLEISMPSQVQRDYQSSENHFPLEVPGAKDGIPGCAIAVEQAFPQNSLAYGKVKIYIPFKSNLEIRIFIIRAEADDDCIAVSKECDPGTTKGFTTGMFTSDQRIIYFDTTAAIKTFYLGFVNDHYNPNEYEASSLPVNGRVLLEGNYGIIYVIKFTNMDKSKINGLRITPQWKYVHGGQEYVVFDGYKWTVIHISDGKSKDIYIPSTGELKFILPGSGCGNICFDLIQR